MIRVMEMMGMIGAGTGSLGCGAALTGFRGANRIPPIYINFG